ncbi:hypothetical protein [Kineococcus sp. SYSU DK005]|uniref:hypothetical protein n=1 Tax=Kineococcus sp. SYSU DK005 TaxID=3383126 RepID=UPI003D7E65B2
MWETWREEMRTWDEPQWQQWYHEHEERSRAIHEQERWESEDRRQRITQLWGPSGDPKQDFERLSELHRRDRLEHPSEMRRAHEQRESIRRQEVSSYPTLPLRHHADLRHSDRRSREQEPVTVGFGPAGEALAVWAHGGDGAVEVSHHAPDGTSRAITPVPPQPDRHKVQPLPDGQVLLVSARCREGEDNAAVYDDIGRLVCTAHIGDAIEHLLSTADGEVWTAYFDEGVFTGSGLSTHGLVRFGTDLSPRWRYPHQNETDLPLIGDCYALNVCGEKAWAYAYDAFHLVSAEGQHAHDHGPAPFSGARALLVDGDRAALIGGYTVESDVITPLCITPDGPRLTGPPQRLTMPDGQPPSRARYTGRGCELHVAVGATWYRLDLDAITPP